MKPTLLLAGLLALASLGATTNARRLTNDALLTTGDATTQASADADCLRARALAVDTLHDKRHALHGLLHDCTRMLLYAGYKWIDADQARAYCKSDACHQFVAALDDAVPACVWTNVPSDSDSELLMAQRVRADCAP